MTVKLFNSSSVPAPMGHYSHLAECAGEQGLVFLSGVVPLRADGTCPETFAEQADQIYANIVTMLSEVDLKPTDIVKLSSFIVAMDDDPGAMGRARAKHFGDHKPAASGYMVVGLADAKWKLEVEVIAQRPK